MTQKQKIKEILETYDQCKQSRISDVMCRFTEDDLDNCWQQYKAYLIEILNGDYDLNKAREDLKGLIGSEYDERIKNGT